MLYFYLLKSFKKIYFLNNIENDNKRYKQLI